MDRTQTHERLTDTETTCMTSIDERIERLRDAITVQSMVTSYNIRAVQHNSRALDANMSEFYVSVINLDFE